MHRNPCATEGTVPDSCAVTVTTVQPALVRGLLHAIEDIAVDEIELVRAWTRRSVQQQSILIRHPRISDKFDMRAATRHLYIRERHALEADEVGVARLRTHLSAYPVRGFQRHKSSPADIE